jgi:hypothetical protein
MFPYPPTILGCAASTALSAWSVAGAALEYQILFLNQLPESKHCAEVDGKDLSWDHSLRSVLSKLATYRKLSRILDPEPDVAVRKPVRARPDERDRVADDELAGVVSRRTGRTARRPEGDLDQHRVAVAVAHAHLETGEGLARDDLAEETPFRGGVDGNGVAEVEPRGPLELRTAQVSESLLRAACGPTRSSMSSILQGVEQQTPDWFQANLARCRRQIGGCARDCSPFPRCARRLQRRRQQRPEPLMVVALHNCGDTCSSGLSGDNEERVRQADRADSLMLTSGACTNIILVTKCGKVAFLSSRVLACSRRLLPRSGNACWLLWRPHDDC